MTALINILLVDDNPDDVELTLAALRKTKLANKVTVVSDGIEALQYLRKQGQYSAVEEPALVLLDLNMPRKDGREVLAEMKADKRLRQIPVVVLTTSESEVDVSCSYDLHANCYISKPVDLSQLVKIVITIEEFWFGVVRLPSTK